MKKKHVKIPAKFNEAVLTARQEAAITRYKDGYVDGSRNFVFPCSERYEFSTLVEAYQFCIEQGSKGRMIYDKRPINQFPGCVPVYLVKTKEDQEADIVQIKADVEAQYRADIEADKQAQIALLIEQQEALFQRKEAERLEADKQARLAEFRKAAEEVL